MKTGHLWKRGFGVFGAVGMIVLTLLFIPTGSEAQSEWVQTTQADFDNATTKYNVDTTSDPGNVSLVSNSTDWIKARSNPLVDDGFGPSVIVEDGKYRMYFSRSVGIDQAEIFYAESEDGIHWGVFPDPVMTRGPFGSWSSQSVSNPTVIKAEGMYRMWYNGLNESSGYYSIGIALSSDGLNWTESGMNPVLEKAPSGWDAGSVQYPTVLRIGNEYKMWFYGIAQPPWITGAGDVGYANSPDGYNWTKYPGNPVISKGPGWDSDALESGPVVYQNGLYEMWYNGHSSGVSRIGYANSTDGIAWTKYSPNPVLVNGSPGSWDSSHACHSSVVLIDGGLRIWYSGHDGSGWRIGHAVSVDGLNWTKKALNPMLSPGLQGSWDDYAVGAPTILKEGSIYKMWFQGVSSAALWRLKIGYAESADGLVWSKRPTPVLSPDPGSIWEQYGIDRPVVLKIGSTYKMWYDGYSDLTGFTNRIGYAESSDGINWARVRSTPVLGPGGPGEWDDVAIWKATVMYESGTYRMWYSGNDGVNCHSSVGYAESTDGLDWTRHPANPILNPGLPGSWDDLGIEVSHVEKVDGQYVMWYNRHCPPQAIGMATSADGLTWTKYGQNPVLEKGGAGSWDDEGVTWLTVLREGSATKIWYSGDHSSGNWRMRVGHATGAYSTLGTLESSIHDSAGEGTSWETIDWVGDNPVGTALALSARAGDSLVPDVTWTDWTPEVWNSTSLNISAFRNRYLQYRVTFYSLEGRFTPVLNEVRVTYGANTATPPTLLAPDDGGWTSETTPEFGWQYDDLEGDPQMAFIVEIDNSDTFTTIDYTSSETQSSQQTSTPDSPIADGIWYWRVRTQDSYGLWSENSSARSFEVDTSPSAPTGLHVEPGARGELKLVWNANPEDDIAGYNVFRSNISSGSFEMINDDLVPNPSYSDTGLPDETTFYYVVTAVDNRGQESTNSEEVFGTTIAASIADWLGEYWWILLLIILIVIVVIVILMARRRKPEEEEAPAAEEPAEPEVRETEMTDEERLEKLERRFREGEIPEDIYAELKERYGEEG